MSGHKKMADPHPTQPPHKRPDKASPVCVEKDAAFALKTTSTQASISSKEERGSTALTTSPVNASTFKEKGSSSGQPLKKKNRTFAEIISDDLRDRNIIEIIFTKIAQINSDRESVAPKQLSIEDQGEFIFDVLKIEDKSIKGVNLFTNKKDTKEINLEAHIDPTPSLQRHLSLSKVMKSLSRSKEQM